MRFARCLCRARTDAVGVGHLLAGMEASTMPHRKHVSKRKGRKEVVPALGAVGMSLSLAGGASAGTGGPAAVADVPSRTIAPNHEITLNEAPTSAWVRSMSSTRKTPEHPGSANSMPAEAAGAAAAEAAEAAAEVAEAAAAEAAAAVCHGESAASARPEHFPITLTDARRHGRVRPGQPRLVLQSPRPGCAAQRVLTS
jgi:hypothetical protein